MNGRRFRGGNTDCMGAVRVAKTGWGRLHSQTEPCHTAYRNESPVCVGVFLSYPVFSRSLFPDATYTHIGSMYLLPPSLRNDLSLPLATFYAGSSVSCVADSSPPISNPDELHVVLECSNPRLLDNRRRVERRESLGVWTSPAVKCPAEMNRLIKWSPPAVGVSEEHPTEKKVIDRN